MFIAFFHTLGLCEMGLLVGLSVSEVLEITVHRPSSFDGFSLLVI